MWLREGACGGEGVGVRGGRRTATSSQGSESVGAGTGIRRVIKRAFKGRLTLYQHVAQA